MLVVVREPVRVTSNNYLRLNFPSVGHIFHYGHESNPAPSAPKANDLTNELPRASKTMRRRVPVTIEF